MADAPTNPMTQGNDLPLRAAERRAGFWLAVVLVGGPLLYLLGNNRLPLWDRDEPWYAQCSREMLHSGNWVVPTFGGQWRTEKPPLIYWAQTICMKVLGETSFAVRLPSALAMSALLLLLGLLVRRTMGTVRAVWTVLILGTTASTVWAAKSCLTDAMQLLFIASAGVCLLAIYQGQRSRWVAVGMWTAIALAGLTKGPMVLAVLGMTLIVLACLDGAIGWWRYTRPLMGIAILGAIVGPWLILVHKRAEGFLTQLIEAGARHVGTPTHAHTGPPGYHLVAIWAAFFPWCLLLPAGLILGWRHRGQPVVRFALAAVIGPWIFAELMRTKLPTYLMPAYPALAFLCADALVRCARGEYQLLSRGLSLCGVALWSLAVLGLAAGPWLVVGWLAPPALPRSAGYAMTALTLVAGTWAVAVFYLFRTRSLWRAGATVGVGMALIVVILSVFWLPQVPALRLSQRIADMLVAQGATHAGDAVMIGYKEPSLGFYQGGTIAQAQDEYLKEQPVEKWPLRMVISEEDWELTPQRFRDQAEVLATFHGLNVGNGMRGEDVLVLKRK